MTAHLISIASGSSHQTYELIANAFEVLETDTGAMRQLAAESTLFNTPDPPGEEKLSKDEIYERLKNQVEVYGNLDSSESKGLTGSLINEYLNQLPPAERIEALKLPLVRAAHENGLAFEKFTGRTNAVEKFIAKHQYVEGQEAFNAVVDLLETVELFPGRALGFIKGDVHMTAFGGLHYDFQAAGEFVFTRSDLPGDTFQIQARLEAPFNGAAVTVITQLGMAIGGDRVTIDATRAEPLWINGSPAGLSDNVPAIQLAGGQVIRVSDARYVLSWNTGQNLTVTDRGTVLDAGLDIVFLTKRVRGGIRIGLARPKSRTCERVRASRRNSFGAAADQHAVVHHIRECMARQSERLSVRLQAR